MDNSSHVQRWLHWIPLFVFTCAAVSAIWITAVSVECKLLCIQFDKCIDHQPSVGTVAVDAKVQLGELRSRLGWGISALFSVVALIVTAFAIAGTLRLSTPRRSLPSVAVVVISGYIVLMALSMIFTTYTFNVELLHQTVFAITRTKLTVGALEGAGYATLIALAVTVSMILRRVSELADTLRANHASASIYELSVLRSMLHVILYLGALTLVAGTLQAASLYRWASTLLELGDYVAVDEPSLTATMALLNGAYFSVFLAAIFIPGLTLYHYFIQRAARLSNPASSEAERDQWLSDNKLNESLSKQIVSAGAVLAPLLAGGPLAHALSSLFG